MAVLALAIGDKSVATRLAVAVEADRDIEVVFVGTDPWVIGRLFGSREVAGVCVAPSAPDKFLRLRRVVSEFAVQGSLVRMALVVAQADAAFVYHVLGYGVDDVITLSQADGELGTSLRAFANGMNLACRELLVPTVDVPVPILHCAIDDPHELDLKIARLVSVGYTDREIAEILHFSHQAVRNRISQILLRSGLKNRTQLATRYTVESITRGLRT